jgi:hypothetical protein
VGWRLSGRLVLAPGAGKELTHSWLCGSLIGSEGLALEDGDCFPRRLVEKPPLRQWVWDPQPLVTCLRLDTLRCRLSASEQSLL